MTAGTSERTPGTFARRPFGQKRGVGLVCLPFANFNRRAAAQLTVAEPVPLKPNLRAPDLPSGSFFHGLSVSDDLAAAQCYPRSNAGGKRGLVSGRRTFRRESRHRRGSKAAA